MTPWHDFPERVSSGDHLYSNAVGHDACGIGGIAAHDGTASRELVSKALHALTCLEHRGGCCGPAGDGAGLTTTIPQAFFHEEARKLNLDQARYLQPEQSLALGVFFFFDHDTAKQHQARGLIQHELADGPVHFMGWRAVPTRDSALPELAKLTRPASLEQAIVRVDGDPTSVEAWLYHKRLRLQQIFRDRGLGIYIASLSSRLISYKGLLTSQQFIDFFPDLNQDTFTAGIALFHRRYSTNTYPNWMLAQPFRFSCHNGEINTIRTNRNAVYAYAHSNATDPVEEWLTPQMSDSCSLDEWLEHLMLSQQWSLLRALRLSVPPVWDTEADFWGQGAVDLFTYCRRTYGSLCAWDGPAGMVTSDGVVLAGIVDRMGLRPVRWCSDQRGWLYIGSESGVFGVDHREVVASGQLQPGQMIALDTRTGERLDSHQILERIVYEVQVEGSIDLHELNRQQIILPEAFDFAPQIDDQVNDTLEQRKWSMEQLLQAYGWDFERATFVKDMAKLKKEPLSSMGYDRVLSIFSTHHPTLFKYMQQTFAEVTNPPIDPYREGGAMSLTTYLGRGPLPIGQDLPVRQMETPTPVLNDAVVEEMRRNELMGFYNLSAVFPLQGGENALAEALHALRSEAEKAVHNGYHVLCLTDREAFADGMAPIPSLLALGAVHDYLCTQGLRQHVSLVIQAGDVQEGHDIAVLVGFGADAVHPYLMLRLIKNGYTFKDPDTKQEFTLSAHECLENVFAALEDSLKKILSKMGITTVEGYRGARLFEGVGFGPELMAFLGEFPSRVGGLRLCDLVEDVVWRLKRAEQMKAAVLGRNKDYLAFNAQIRMALRKAAVGEFGEGGEADYAQKRQLDQAERDLSKEYLSFTQLINTRPPTVLRDLFLLKPGDAPIARSDVQSALSLVQDHFRGAAMSHGALTGIAHQTLAAAFNELGGYSNSGEGGEARDRNDLPERMWGPWWETILAQRATHPNELALHGDPKKSRFRSRIRQVASGRFGVDAEYLVNGDEIQIKMAQGAKPGEGGQLMGKKVTAEIAENRYARPGIDLISPPPHHDIYSIEDLAQLIADLKAVRPGVPVSVKLVAVENIGTIAVGVAKAGANVIEIDGLDGGTGAAMVSSKEHTGLPSEMGLAEAHQALALNGLRTQVRLRVGGGIKNGYDIIKYALLGAEEFSLGQALMVSVGCIVCKSCHIPNCPTGITGSPEIFKGHPEHTKSYLLSLAEEVRQLLANLGERHVQDIVGRSDLLVRNPNLPGRAGLIDLSRFLHPELALSECARRETTPRVEAAESSSKASHQLPVLPVRPTLNERIIDAASDAVEAAQSIDLMFRIRNSDRSVGATIAGQIARLYGREGMANHRRIKVRFDGEAGQSFGAWCINSLDLELVGFAQDGVAKGISGGHVVVTLDYQKSSYGGTIQSVAGNNVAYGATGGTVFLGGRAGHRLGIRNSGATIVAEAAGKYACEYMIRGRVVILGPVENEIGAGMTGGELFIYDPENEVPAKLHSRSVAVIDCHYVDYEWLHPLIIHYHARTGSRQAERVLRDWSDIRRSRHLRKVVPLAVARRAEDFIAAGTNAG